MEKLTAIWGLFRQGESVADPAKWKAGQITATVLGGVLMALVNLAAAFGHPLPVDTSTANSIGAGILACVNVVLTVTTCPHMGLPAIAPVPSNDAPAETGVQHIDQATIERAEKWQRGQR